MQRLKVLLAKLSGTNLAALVFFSLATKATVFNITLPEALAFLCACAVYGFHSYLKSKQPDPIRINSEVQKELDNIKGAMSALKLEKNISSQAKRFF